MSEIMRLVFFSSSSLTTFIGVKEALFKAIFPEFVIPVVIPEIKVQK
jgi:4'-phosphopantetheinyl transferase EntD